MAASKQAGSWFLVLAAAGSVVLVASAWIGRRWRKHGSRGSGQAGSAVAKVVELCSLPTNDVPPRLRPEFYFNLLDHPFAHSELLTSAHNVIDVLSRINGYVVQWLDSRWTSAQSAKGVRSVPAATKVVGQEPLILVEESSNTDAIFCPDILIGAVSSSAKLHTLHVEPGVKILGGTFDLGQGGIWLGAGATVEPGTSIAGPTIIGKQTTLRTGVYIRGDVIIGDGAVLRGELKNSVIMDAAELAHPGYAGDTIIGYKGHFGCQALSANLGLFGHELSVTLPAERHIAVTRVNLGRRKIGLILGDHSQLGCCTVSDPATFLGPQTHVYPLCRLASGFYGPNEIIKNKPEACGVLVRETMRPISN